MKHPFSPGPLSAVRRDRASSFSRWGLWTEDSFGTRRGSVQHSGYVTRQRLHLPAEGDAQWIDVAEKRPPHTPNHHHYHTHKAETCKDARIFVQPSQHIEPVRRPGLTKVFRAEGSSKESTEEAPRQEPILGVRPASHLIAAPRNRSR